MTGEFVTVKEAAQIIRRTPRTINNWISRGLIQTVLTPLGHPLIVRSSLFGSALAGTEMADRVQQMQRRSLQGIVSNERRALRKRIRQHQEILDAANAALEQ